MDRQNFTRFLLIFHCSAWFCPTESAAVKRETQPDVLSSLENKQTTKLANEILDITENSLASIAEIAENNLKSLHASGEENMRRVLNQMDSWTSFQQSRSKKNNLILSNAISAAMKTYNNFLAQLQWKVMEHDKRIGVQVPTTWKTLPSPFQPNDVITSRIPFTEPRFQDFVPSSMNPTIQRPNVDFPSVAAPPPVSTGNPNVPTGEDALVLNLNKKIESLERKVEALIKWTEFGESGNRQTRETRPPGTDPTLKTVIEDRLKKETDKLAKNDLQLRSDFKDQFIMYNDGVGKNLTATKEDLEDEMVQRDNSLEEKVSFDRELGDRQLEEKIHRDDVELEGKVNSTIGKVSFEINKTLTVAKEGLEVEMVQRDNSLEEKIHHDDVELEAKVNSTIGKVSSEINKTLTVTKEDLEVEMVQRDNSLEEKIHNDDVVLEAKVNSTIGKVSGERQLEEQRLERKISSEDKALETKVNSTIDETKESLNNKIDGDMLETKRTVWRTVESLAKGMKGARGDRGPRGFKGQQGRNGAKGNTGAPGRHGMTGQKGRVGAKGDTGAPGRHGTPGQRGIPGAKGEDGIPGLTGRDGEKGDIGAPGLTGLKGNKGSSGATGDKGDPGNVSGSLKGEKGEAGNKGEQGIQGQTGLKGEPGKQGQQGETGAAGPKGDPGVNGMPGVEGPPGAPGPLGPPGTKGEPGVSGVHSSLEPSATTRQPSIGAHCLQCYTRERSRTTFPDFTNTRHHTLFQICGIDGKTYDSNCTFNELVSCQSGSSIRVWSYPGPCRRQCNCMGRDVPLQCREDCYIRNGFS